MNSNNPIKGRLKEEDFDSILGGMGISPKSGVTGVSGGTGTRSIDDIFAPAKPKIVDESQEQKPGFWGKVSEIMKRRGQNIKETFVETAKPGFTGITPIETGIRTVGDVFGGASEVIGTALISGLKLIPGAEEAGQKILQTKIAQDGLKSLGEGLESYEKWKQNNKRTAEVLEGVVDIGSFMTDIAGGVALKKPVQAGLKVAKEAAEGAVEVGEHAVRTGISKIKDSVIPPVSVKEVSGKILQGTTEDVESGIKALSSINTKDVKTFEELSSRLNEKIPELAKVVDDELAKDTTEYTLNDLAVSATTRAGKEIKTDFVSQALNHLSELYSAIGDEVKRADILDTLKKAKTSGLTRQEVNDISRVYNVEFGNKAFSKIGEPLTSINAQKFENVRKGLKNVARAGIGGKVAKQADELMSSLYNTQRLVDRSVEAVNKLRQKIDERGLLEKIGHTASKTLDILTGGTVRGFVGGLLPRGAGYKVLNALDLEKQLQKNLKLFEKALKSEKDVDIINALNDIKLPKGKAVTPSAEKGAEAMMGGIAGIEVDEEGNVSFNPEKAVFGIVGMTAFQKLSPKAKGQLLKEVENASDDLVKLAKEAKKYKSAEEFVKARPSYYHSTKLENIPKIEKQGFSGNIGEMSKASGGEMQKGVFLYPERRSAEVFSKNFKNSDIIETSVNGKIYDANTQNKYGWEDNLQTQEIAKDSEIISQLKKDGYVGVKSTELGTDAVFVFEPSKVKTKSQLTDIWEKANKGIVSKVETLSSGDKVLYNGEEYKFVKNYGVSGDKRLIEDVSGNQVSVSPKEIQKVSSAEGIGKYGMSHRPTETGAMAHNITLNETIPKDFYEHPEWYFNMKQKSYQESFNALRKIKGKPDAEITIYRASPKNELNRGDWVTLSKEYAKGESLSEKVKVHSFKVKAKDIQFAGDDINEFGYYPQ